MIIGVDIGGTKTLVATFKHGEITRQDRFATPKPENDFLADLLPLLAAHAKHHHVEAISIAIPGMIDVRRGIVLWCGNLPWTDFELKKAIKEHFPDTPVLLENDANLAGLAEARSLLPIPRLCLYVTVSTGVGTGIIINGKLTPALSGSEAGHMRLKRNGAYVEWEDFASGSALKERVGHLASEIRDPGLWHDAAERVADGLLALIPALQPGVIVIGGSIGTYFDARWRSSLEHILEDRLSPETPQPPILQAQHPEEAVLYGCNYHAQQYLGTL